ncbi:MAG: bifunctional methylenetetrahydrofolate dehydrogenase/methenyltetrahydrofolate cyclohydrolase FolD [Alphaproteobacteria bacterium]|nr:bifunctional methylenetetrahydrofolate dehydrogenase/methenyltetrahydrofolate cyclohydrolase FolD [Alphaproteobacteria bacterium]
MTDPAKLIDGKAFAATMRARITQQIVRLKQEHGITPGLAAVLVGDDPASWIYVGLKEKQSADAGMRSFVHRLAADTSENELLALVRKLNADPQVSGILVQMPLPKAIDPARVIEAIAPEKDVDGFHPINAGRLASGRPAEALLPCTPLGCLLLLRHRLGDLAGKHAVVLGRSTIVGRPMAQLLLTADCTVTIAHSKSRDLPALCRQADILVAAVGRTEMVRGDWIKPGASVIDVGMNRLPPAPGADKGKLVGDVAFAEAIEIAGAITPVPGGVGPMTIACLLHNTLIAACRQAGVSVPQPL